MVPKPSALVASTLRELEGVNNDADYRRIADNVMKYAAPTEIKTLFYSIVAPSPFRNWLRDLYAHVVRHRADVSPFFCSYASSSISRYSTGGSARTLIIGFCGKTGYLHGPIAILMQYFPQDAVDFLVLRDPEMQGFAGGISGYANSFQGVIEKLRTDFDFGRYEDIRCVGSSSGSAAALAAGQLLGASRLVSLSGRPPSHSRTHGKTAAADSLEGLIAAKAADPETAFLVFGANNAEDSRGAEGLAKLLSATFVPIDGIADHNIVAPLHRSGDLAPILRRVGLS